MEREFAMQRAHATESACFIGSHTALDSVDAVINVDSGLATSVADVGWQLGAAFSASPRLVDTELSARCMMSAGRVS